MSSSLRPTALRVDDLADPVGTSGAPAFGWRLEHPDPDQIQTCYQLLVASAAALLDLERGDVWDSGPVASRVQAHVAYGGTPLTGNTKYFWKVRAWDRAGGPGPYSEPGTFVVGLLKDEDWAGAQWIRRDSADEDDYTFYRRTFFIPQARVERATLFISAVHKYELYLNGSPIGSGPSYHYPQYQYYNAYDLTPHLAAGASNTIAVLTHWFGGGQGRPASARGLLVKLVVEQAGGGRTWLGSDAGWKQKRADGWVAGQPPRNDEGVGYLEKIDAGQLIGDWFAPAYDDAGWEPAVEIGPHPSPPWTGTLLPDLSRIEERVLRPVSVTNRGGAWLVDLGQVYAGRPRLEVSGGRAGAIVRMLGGYGLGPDGAVDPRFNQNTDMSYEAVLNGDRFTFLPMEYLGMRYFQVENAPMPVTTENFAFIERHAVLDEARSAFTSSSAVLNEVWALMKRSVALGAQEQFLDTPTREKGGFLVDSLNESLAAMAAYGERVLTRKTLQEFLHSMDQYWAGEADRGRMNAVYPNGDGARDIPDFTQAYLVWAWDYYLQTGDRAFLSDHYPKLKNIADYAHRHLDPATGLIHNLTGGGSGAYRYGIVDWPPSMRYGYDMATEARTVINLLAYAGDDIVSKIAAAIGDTADRDRYRARAEALRSAINARLLNADGVYVDGLKPGGAQSEHVSQHANMLPLALGVVPAEHRAAVTQVVKAFGMRAGMVTVGWLIQALGESGEGEHLVGLFTNSAWDGWARTLARGGTSTWESWDADSGGGLSQSHPWGAIGVCGIQQYVLGVKPLAPQFESAQIRPLGFGAALTSAEGRVPTERGDITVAWAQRDEGFWMRVTLPVNVQARVCLPGTGGGQAVRMDGVPVSGALEGTHIVVENVGSGTHTFERG